MSTVPYGCATDALGAAVCMQGVTKTAMQWGDLVRAAEPGFGGPWPRVQIWQGSADTAVAPSNAAALVAQWTDVLELSQTPTSDDGKGHTTYGNGKVEAYVVAGMGHAISIGGAGCPATAASFFEDHNLCSTLLAAEFFGLEAGSGSDGSGSGSGSDGSGGGGGGSASGTHSSGGCASGGGDLGASLAILALVGSLRSRRRITPRAA